MYFKSNIKSLIWGLKHLITNGTIILRIREALIPSSNDLILLLTQFSNITLYCGYFTNHPSPGGIVPLEIICTNFKNKDKLINYLEKIMTFENSMTMSFFKIKKVIMGPFKEIEKNILNISEFCIDRVIEFRNIEKTYKGNITETSKINDIITYKLLENAIKFKFIPKPENFPFISELIYSKKININDSDSEKIKFYKKEEGNAIYKLIKLSKAKIILEIGMDYGIMSLFILQSLKYLNFKYNEDSYYRLTSIDPYQESKWGNIGIENLKKAKLINNHKLIKEYSYTAMPKLVEQHKLYDIILINGQDNYDQTINDLFNAFNLLKFSGYLVINNSLYPGVMKIIRYIDENYPLLNKFDWKYNVKSLVIYFKTSDYVKGRY